MLLSVVMAIALAGCCDEARVAASRTLAGQSHVAVVRFHEGSGEVADTLQSQSLREAIARSIRVGVESATVWPPPQDMDRVMARTSVRIDDPPCDLAFEVVWPEISTETFGVIWARKGTESQFQSVRMLMPPKMWGPTQLWSTLWPPTHIRTVDVLLRPSPPLSYPMDSSVPYEPRYRLDLNHAGMSEAWSEGVIVIEDVPLEWRMKGEQASSP